LRYFDSRVDDPDLLFPTPRSDEYESEGVTELNIHEPNPQQAIRQYFARAKIGGKLFRERGHDSSVCGEHEFHPGPGSAATGVDLGANHISLRKPGKILAARADIGCNVAV
jgi:hypothetical protein